MSLEDELIALSRRKAEAVIQTFGEQISTDSIVLAADTIVLHEGHVLGKPKGQQQAEKMLRALSGRQHEVKTAFCLWNMETSEIISEIISTNVFFKVLSEQSIQDYVKSEEPYDKAGAYGIQGRGGDFVDHFEGSYDNVVGLPLLEVEQALNRKNWKLKRE